jgi:hypothetical protein
VPTNPWDRLAGEPGRAYEAFVAFRDAGPERTLGSLNRDRTKGDPKWLSRYKHWSTRWHWLERSLAWDRHLLAARDRTRVAHARRWARRVERARERQYQNAQAVRARCLDMLKFPLSEQRTTRQETVDGQPTVQQITIRPARWNLDTVGRLLRLVADLEAEALGTPIAPAAEPAPAGTDDEETARVAERMLDAGLKAMAELRGEAVDEGPAE